ncbi:hypothetical protein CEXT_223761 [Caerostris extrusa]|uniref:Uncharacterized protein n=1 Tax=Caerostris extrusa TaxID=172846 RepID=A0AAV4XX83_CAEEX|nr:hypothetical protein CEXT_223761 [Caerostris extrusa]
MQFSDRTPKRFEHHPCRILIFSLSLSLSSRELPRAAEIALIRFLSYSPPSPVSRKALFSRNTPHLIRVECATIYHWKGGGVGFVRCMRLIGLIDRELL